MLTLETPRLVIRDMQLKDMATYVHFQMLPEMKQFRQCSATPVIAEWFAEKWIDNNCIHQDRRKSWLMAIFEKETNIMIGDLHLMAWTKKDAHISYGLGPDFWQRGYMSEALACMTDYAHNKADIKKIQEPVLTANIASWRAMEKCGYQRVSEEIIAWESPGIKDTPVYNYISVPGG
jgi:ribosomal-protein-alanine N-acetyltransferase